MAAQKSIPGTTVQVDRPLWDPLFHVVGEDIGEWFMWMGQIELEDGTSVHAYKHRVTRRYLHIDETGRSFRYDGTGGYQPVPMLMSLDLVFIGWDEGPQIALP